MQVRCASRDYFARYKLIVIIIYQVSKFIHSSIYWLKNDHVKVTKFNCCGMRSARALKVLMPGY